MKKKEIEDLRNKSIKELEKEAGELRKEIGKLQLEARVNPPKDTNTLVKKRKHLAILLTIIREKQ